MSYVIQLSSCFEEMLFAHSYSPEMEDAIGTTDTSVAKHFDTFEAAQSWAETHCVTRGWEIRELEACKCCDSMGCNNEPHNYGPNCLCRPPQ